MYGPQKVKVLRLTSTHLTVSWELLSLKEARGFITQYSITAEPASTGSGSRQERPVTMGVSHNVTRGVLDGLSPRLAYWVSVSASTVAGTSTSNKTFVDKLGMHEHIYHMYVFN